MSRMVPPDVMRLTTPASSSSRTQGLVTLAWESTTTNASAAAIPSSTMRRTSESPGPISHSENHASTPASRRLVAKGRTKRDWSSDA